MEGRDCTYTEHLNLNNISFEKLRQNKDIYRLIKIENLLAVIHTKKNATLILWVERKASHR